MKKLSEKIFPSEEEAVTFKKSMRGYDMDEVNAYIAEMSNTIRETSKNYENRMAEKNQELMLSSRENNTLRERCGMLENKLGSALAELQTVKEAKESAKNAETSELSEAKAMIEKLKKQLEEERSAAEQCSSELSEAKSRIEEINGRMLAKEKELSAYESRLGELQYTVSKESDIRLRYEEALILIENLKSSVETLTEEKKRLEEEAADNEIRYHRCDTENSSLKTEISRINVENLLLTKKNEQHRAEITELKNEAKNKAYSYAEKLSDERAALDEEKIRFQRKVQLQTFHIEQATTAVEELKKQIEQIRLSFSE